MGNLPKIINIMPSIRGLNLWTLMQKIKDATIMQTPTFQLFHRIDIYENFNSLDLKWLAMLNFVTQKIRFAQNVF